MNKIKRSCPEKLNHKGYSMVEMIIIIAIVAILSALSFITVNIIYSAKATAAGNSFNTQLSHLASLTKAQDASLAIKLYYKTSEKKYYIQYGNIDSSNTFVKDTGVTEVGLSNSITIYYTPEGSDPTDPDSETKIDNDSDTAVIIKFNKSDGAVAMGAGNYRIAKGENGASYSIALNRNTGSHYIK